MDRGLGSFVRTCDRLMAKVGGGNLVGGVSYAGPHAVAHHEHPQGGPAAWDGKPDLDYSVAGTGPGYLRIPMMARHPMYLEMIASRLYEDPNEAMEDAMDNLLGLSHSRVPKDPGRPSKNVEGELAKTGTAWVADGRNASAIW